MKTWEMVKELMENPKRKYISNAGETLEMIAQIKHGCLSVEFRSGRVTSIDITRDWEEVKKPVSFMEAAESGKRIEMKHPLLRLDNTEYPKKYNHLQSILTRLAEGFGSENIRNILTEAEFYIEEES